MFRIYLFRVFILYKFEIKLVKFDHFSLFYTLRYICMALLYLFKEEEEEEDMDHPLNTIVYHFYSEKHLA